MTRPAAWFTLILVFLAGLAAPAVAEPRSPFDRWIDQTHRLFFPKSAGSIVMVQADFPVLWWSFLALETPRDREPDWRELEVRCQNFTTASGPLIRRIFCGQKLTDPTETLRDWSRDYLLRHPRPKLSELNDKINTAMAQASLPIGPLVQVLRQDPFGSLFELKNLLESQSASLKLEQHGGFFWDRKTSRVLIPVQFAFAPSETAKMAEVEKHLAGFCPESPQVCRDPLFIGAHASTFENETQIKVDLNHVSVVSLCLLSALSVFVLITRRWRLIFLLPPILGATLLAAIATVLVFGRIHGLTLAFGPGIVGLAMDYGLHLAFSNQPTQLLRANVSGFLTTVVVLLVMMASQIPLLQQLMFFSSLGLSLCFALIYLLFKRAPWMFEIRPYGIGAPKNPWLSALVLVTVVASVTLVFKTELSLDMRQLSFETEKRRELNRWFYESAGGQGPLLQVTAARDGAGALAQAHEQKLWAQGKGLRLKNVASFLPSESEQRENLASWQGTFCGENSWQQSLPPDAQQFFAPYFKLQSCEPLEPLLLKDSSQQPSYLRDFGSGDQWLTVWSPSSDQETELIKARYPEVISFVDIAMLFPKIFKSEMTWMTPLSLGLAFMILILHYRGLRLAAIAVTPFFSGLGLYLLLAQIFAWKTTFISVIGLIMVFGLSLDHGVFATELMRRQRERPDEGVWTALSVAAIVNVVGFLPLMLCRHPVLESLGQTLFFGTIGTYLGSVWGIPGLYRWLRLEAR